MAFVIVLVTGDALTEIQGSTTVDLNAVTNLILPTADPTADGEIAVDITPAAEFADDLLTWWGGTNIMSAIALAADQMPSGAGEDGFHVKYNATANEFQLVAAAGGGDVSATGSPLDNEIAVFTDGTTIDSDSTFTWDGSTLAITGNLTITTDLIVAHGGTGISTATDGGVLIGATTGAFEVTDAGTVGSDTLADEFLHAKGAGNNPDYKGIEQTVSITIETPVVNDNITIRHFSIGATIQEVHAILIGTGSDEVTFNLYMDATRTTESTKAFSSDKVLGDGTTATRYTPDTAGIAADDFFFIDISAATGSPTELHITVRYTTT